MENKILIEELKYETGLSSIIIPVHNNLSYTKKCIEALLAKTFVPYEIIVINNASSDGTCKYLEALIQDFVQFAYCQDIKVIHNTENKSFSVANNQGAKIANGEFLICLNNDTEVESSWLSNIVTVFEKEKNVGIIGAKLLYPDRRIQHAGITVTKGVKIGHIFKNAHENLPAVNFRREVKAVTGACLAVRHHLFDSLDGYNEEYKNAWEDVDLCFRVRKAEYSVLYLPETVVIHHESKTAGRFKDDRFSSSIFLKYWQKELIADEEEVLNKAGMHSTLVDNQLLYDFIDLSIEERRELGYKAFNDLKFKEVIKYLEPVYLVFPDCEEQDFYLSLACAYERTFQYDKMTDLLQTLSIKFDSDEVKQFIEDFKYRSFAYLQDKYKAGLVSIIVPVFNNLNYTKKAISSIFENSKGSVSYEIIVINNNSSDGTKEYLDLLKDENYRWADECRAFKVLHNSENRSFSAANNQGAEISQAEYLFCLNNDTEVQRGWLSEMFKTADCDPFCGIVGAKLIYPDRSIQHCGVVFNENKTLEHLYKGFDFSFNGANAKREYQAVTAACMLIRHDIFDMVNGFDEKYQNCFEDVDLCLKVREAGWKVIYCPNSLVVHHESKTPGRRDGEAKAGKLLGQKWFHKIKADKREILMAAGLALQNDPENGEYIDLADQKIENCLVQAYSYFNEDNYFQSIRLLLKVYVLDPENMPDNVYVILASCYEKLGNLLKARFYLEKAVLCSENKLAAEVLEEFYKRHQIVRIEHDIKKELAVKSLGISKIDEMGFTKELTSIIIPVFNNLHFTKDAIDAIFNNTVCDYELIVVNNNSTDGTLEYLDEIKNNHLKLPQNCKAFKVIRNDENKRFSMANNQGAALAEGEFLLCLNNDTRVGKGWLSAMIATLKRHNDVAMVGAKLVYEDLSIQHAGVVIAKNCDIPFHFMQHADFDHPAVNREREFQAVTAACMLIRHDVFDEVGGFNEEYINCFEDMDLCFKVRDKGYRIFYSPGAVVEHFESKTAGRKDNVGYSATILRKYWHNKMKADAEQIYSEFGMTVVLNKKTKTIIVDFADMPMLEMLKEAEKEYYNKNYYKVIDLLSKIYSLNPQKTEEFVYILLGMAYEMIGNLAEAEKLFKISARHYSSSLTKNCMRAFSEKYKTIL